MEYEENIENLTREQLIDDAFIPSLYKAYPDDTERKEVFNGILAVAKKQGVLKKVKQNMQEYELQQSDVSALLYMTIGSKDKPEVTVDNYKQAILNTSDIKDNVRYNAFTNKFERKKDNGSFKSWDDNDDAWIMSLLETRFKIYDRQKYYQGLLLCKNELSYHPIKELIEEKEWDGIPRIDRFLTEVMKCDDNDYSREVSRMIFYGGINRIYDAGCKFDYMPILIGKQGVCKSTLVNWLSLGNGYREIVSIDGKDGMDLLNGAWICEFSELLALIRAKEVESMKAYITRQVDTFRPAYARHSVSIPRQCIFIGTTNNKEFLIDKTGNRRYLPIEVKLEEGELYEHEQAIKNCILECWREAFYLYKQGKAYLVIPREYTKELKKHQDMASVDDGKLGMLTSFLDTKEIGYKVCGIEIYLAIQGNISKKYTKSEALDIVNMMQHFPNWKRHSNLITFENYGRQKYWEKIE